MSIGNFSKSVKKVFKKLGPGFITGAADDDPSGIATYSIAGAQFGYKLNWLSLFLIPMMISIQEMCGRIGMCAGTGLAGVIKKYYSKKLLYSTIGLLIVANIINVSANLNVMAASLNMISGLPFYFWLAIITIASVILEIFVPYKIYSNYLRIMGLSLLVYCITALIAKQNWLEVIINTIIPHIEMTPLYLMTAVGFIGTTISPYLFFWQADEEVEEEIEKGEIKDFNGRVHITKKDIRYMRKDTTLGMIFSNIVATCVLLTTSSTLHANGIYNISSPQEAALALKPLAGDFAYLLFTFGIIGIGLQSIPIFTAGIAYALSETFGFKEGLNKKFQKAKTFYFIIAASTLIGAVLNIVGINPIKALFYSAVINGVISVPLIAIIIKLSDNEKVVGIYKTPQKNRYVAVITLIFVGLATALMLFSFF